MEIGGIGMTNRLQKSSYLFFALVCLILIADTTLVRTLPYASDDRLLTYALLFDFMLVIPLLYWLFVVRPKGKSISRVLSLPLLGALAAWLVLPATMRSTVWNTIWPVELLVITFEVVFVVYEVRVMYRLFRRFRYVSRQEADTAEALRIAVHDAVGKGKIASLLLHDATMLYYLLFSWKRRRGEGVGDDQLLYTYHRKTSQVLYAAIITKIIAFEGVAVHLLVQQWSHWAAWILTAADLWLLAMIWADCRASVLQPVKLEGGMLRLRYGLRIQANVPLDAIAHVACAREYHPDQKEQRDAVVPLLAAPNVRIELKRPVQVDTLLFLPRSVTNIYLALDEPESFVCDIESKLASE